MELKFFTQEIPGKREERVREVKGGRRKGRGGREKEKEEGKKGRREEKREIKRSVEKYEEGKNMAN